MSLLLSPASGGWHTWPLAPSFYGLLLCIFCLLIFPFLRSKPLVRLGPTRLHWDLYLVTSAGSSIEVLGVRVQSHGAELRLGRAVCSPWCLTAWHLLPMIFWEALLFSSQGHSHPEAKELPVRPLHSVTETLCDPRLAAAESRSALPLLMWGWAGGRRLLFSVSAAAPV